MIKAAVYKFKTAGQYQLCASALIQKAKNMNISKDITVSEILTVNMICAIYAYRYGNQC